LWLGLRGGVGWHVARLSRAPESETGVHSRHSSRWKITPQEITHIARRTFLAQLAGLPFLASGVKAEDRRAFERNGPV